MIALGESDPSLIGMLQVSWGLTDGRILVTAGGRRARDIIVLNCTEYLDVSSEVDTHPVTEARNGVST